MRIARTVAELREATAEARAAGGGIALVPTMGALHDGHLSLVRRARAENSLVAMSIFVNPTQFTDPADLAAYPRTEERDFALAADAGVDVMFAPNALEMYPAGFATTVSVAGDLTATLEGAGRGSAHFDGVATVVAKLLLAALPDAAYFGMKDAQQLLVVRRMVQDLGIPSRIVACPTERDADGLALSSRNVRLDAEGRERALAIPRALLAIETAAATGETDPAELVARGTIPLAEAGIDPEYLAIVDPADLSPLRELDGRPALVLIAARVGDVRLIDNVMLNPEE